MNISKKSGSNSNDHIHDTTHTHLENPLHDKIQFKFDAVFPRSSTGKKAKSSSTEEMDLGSEIEEIPESKTSVPLTIPGGSLNDISLSGMELSLDSTGATKTGQMNNEFAESDAESDSFSLESGDDFALDLGGDTSPEVPLKSTPSKSSEETAVLNTTSTDIDLSNEEISFDLGESQPSVKAESVNKSSEQSSVGMSLGSDDDISFDLGGGEEPVVPIKSTAPAKEVAAIQEDDALDFSFGEEEKSDETSIETNLMSTSEDMSVISDAIDTIVSPSKNEEVISSSDDSSDLFSSPEEPEAEVKDDFDFAEVEFADKEEDISHIEMKDVTPMKQIIPEVEESFEPEVPPPAPVIESKSKASHSERVGFISEEDSNRVHATIRQLREEREELLSQIKQLKVHSKEVEQDNLTLKAALDESKIENTIIKKRHLVEVEDIKYRMAISDEKRAIAEEKAKYAESNRLKLEQKVRIDFNQVKQREKELETKLEMLTLDIDSQVQTRDQKILELRRKIDSLEFNMENVSIREQKSQEDKRKLEDKLSKIMKTLRHSIKNLEDDIDQATEADEEIKIKE